MCSFISIINRSEIFFFAICGKHFSQFDCSAWFFWGSTINFPRNFFYFAFFTFASSSVNRARLFDKNVIVQWYSKATVLSSSIPTSERVTNLFRQMKQDDYFQVNFDYLFLDRTSLLEAVRTVVKSKFNHVKIAQILEILYVKIRWPKFNVT